MDTRARSLWSVGLAVVIAGVVSAVTLLGESGRAPGAGASPSPASSDTKLPKDAALQLAVGDDLKSCFEPSVDLAEPSPGAHREHDGDEQIQYVAQRVEKLRGIPFRTQVLPVWLRDRQLLRRIRQDTLATYPRRNADEQETILRMLGAVRGGWLDLRKLAISGTASNLLGLYVPGTNELLVRYLSNTRTLSPAEEVVLSHEMEHALADQEFDLPTSERIKLRNEDARAAMSAVMEGDASVIERQFVHSSLTDVQRQDYRSDPALTSIGNVHGASPTLRSPYLEDQAGFPYSFGTAFVCGVLERDGWKGVNALYKRPPQSTAEVLFPDRYENEEHPKDPRDPRAPRGWKEQPVESFGAADLMSMFAAPGAYKSHSMDDPYDRARSWAGGEVHVYRRGPEAALALDLVEYPDGLYGLCDSVEAWYRVAFPINDELKETPGERFAIENRWGTAVLRCDGDDVRLGIAPSLGTARALAL